jgi:Myristoyl-CoA:protein N-myristoyltransferase, N-terminal domain
MSDADTDASDHERRDLFGPRQPTACTGASADETKACGHERRQPYALADQVEWSVCDLEDPDVLSEIYEFLRLYYVEGSDGGFRFCYSRDSLQWALCPPGYQKEWHLGVRETATGQLVRFRQGDSMIACARHCERHELLRGVKRPCLRAVEVSRFHLGGTC